MYTIAMTKSSWIEPLYKRVNKTAYMQPSSFIRALQVISPEFVYYYVGQLITYGTALFIGYGPAGTIAPVFFANHSQLLASLIRMSAVIIAVLPLIPSLLKEYPVIGPENKESAGYALIVAAMALGFALFFNSVAIVSGFTGKSQAFSETASAQFALPIWLGIIVYGIVTPITEEIVHRGLIYNRLRRYYNLPIAIIGCSLLFGISHGNLVQLVYGFIMGLLICYVYERLGAFVYPVLFHCIANVAVYVCMSNTMLRAAVSSYYGIILEGTVAVACFMALALAKKIDT